MDHLDLLFKENNVVYNVIAFLVSENEKIFERTDAKLYWRTVLHCFFIYHHAYVGLSALSLGFALSSSPDIELQTMYRFRTCYLTGWEFPCITNNYERTDAKLYWRTVLHCFFIYHHAYVGLSALSLGFALSSNPDIELQTMYRFRRCYSTGWGFTFQTTFLFLALAHDVLEWASKDDTKIALKIKYWRDVVFAGLVVPYTIFVFTMFWSLYAIDRELVFPKVYDAVVPWWFNHCVHSNILVLVIIESILQPRRYPTDRKLELTLDLTITFSYAVVFYSIYFFAGRWLYNVFGIMTWWQVCLFQTMIWISSYVFYEIQWPFNRLIHGQESEPQKELLHVKNSIEQNGATETSETGDGETKNSDIQDLVDGKGQNGDIKINGGNGVNTANIDFKAPPFSTKSWSLKYRSIRNQFENTKL